jgi:hypothetical protein
MLEFFCVLYFTILSALHSFASISDKLEEVVIASSGHYPGTSLHGLGSPQTTRQYIWCHGRDLNRVSVDTGLKERHPDTDLFGCRKLQQKFYCDKSHHFKLQTAIVNYIYTSKYFVFSNATTCPLWTSWSPLPAVAGV